MDKKAFGERIRTLRLQRGYSQKELAYRVQARSPQSVYGWEHGLCYPDLPTVELLCIALGVNTATLFDEQSKDVLTAEESMLIKKFRQLDLRARDMLCTLLDQQFALCQYNGCVFDYPLCVPFEEPPIFLNISDPDYTKVREALPELESAYKRSPLNYEAIAGILWHNGYSTMLSISDVVSIISGHKVPTKALYNDMISLLFHDYGLSSESVITPKPKYLE